MTRVAFSGDQHIGAKHLTTLEEQERVLFALVDATIKRGCRAVVLCGDATHSSRPEPEVLRVWGEAFRQWNKASVPVVAIAGNHEGAGVTSVLEHFRGSIEAVSEPRIVQLPMAGIDLACLPWLPDRFVRARLSGAATRQEISLQLTLAAAEILAGFRAQRRRGVPLVLATHATIAGADTSTGFSMGYVAGDNYILRLEDLDGFNFVAAGHIHKHQWIHQLGGYTGSLLPLDFAETEPKGFILWEPNAVCEFVELPTPTVWTLEWDDRELERVMTAPIVFDGSTGGRVPDKLRVRVKCREENARRFPPAAIVAQLQGAGGKYIQVELDVARPDRVRDADADGLTPASALGRYVETREDLDSDARERVLFSGISTIEKLRAAAGAQAGGDLQLTAIEADDLLGVHHARVEFDGHGVYAVTGPVGAGKSTIGADAPRFALFGASRYGAKVTDQLVRQGADLASAAVELLGADGRRYRVVRKVKRTARGSSSTLDVLEDSGSTETTLHAWSPLSTGKVADGQAVVDRILGGLTDETLAASSIVIQRNADAFMRARPEERKQLLAEAAGLSMFDQLTEASREWLRGAERELELLHAKAAPLQARAAAVPTVEAELADAEREAAKAGTHIAELEHDAHEKRKAYDVADDNADRWGVMFDAAKRLDGEIAQIEDERRQWQQKKLLADLVVTEKDALVAARAALTTARQDIVVLEAQLVAETSAAAERDAALARKANLETRVSGARQTRQQESRWLGTAIEQARGRGKLIDEAVCCKPEPDCVFLTDARAAIAGIPDLETKLAERVEPSDEESALLLAISRFVVPAGASQDPAITRGQLTKARTRALELEQKIQDAEKIARAEEILAQYEEAIARLNVRIAFAQTDKAEKDQQLEAFGPNPRAAANAAQTAWENAVTAIAGARLEESRLTRLAAELRGRLTTLREAAHELEDVEREIIVAAGDVASLKVLVDAWRACRVNVLEASVIPAVEDTANDILRRFPYGMQISMATQRERRSGEGMSEALDVEVLGGRAPVYEGCSGGQRTTIDFALHVAIALVVSRRASSRLRFLFCDEPEGLDEPGRSAFAAIARWAHETFGLTVLVASHAADLVDALGGQRIDVVVGPDGSTVEVAA
jgi:DNA repair exonuclease SbcCD ATPase subunit